MTLHRRNAKRDKSEGEIVAFLRAAGLSVVQISATGVPDILAGYHGRNYLVEVKTGKGKLNENQVRFFNEWRGLPPVILRDLDEAQAWVRTLPR